MVAFPRVSGFKRTRGSSKSWMDNLTWQYCHVGGHSWQFSLPSVLHSTRLHYRTRRTVVLFCECSHQAGRDGERLTKAGRRGGGSRRRTGCKGLPLMLYLLHLVCTARLKVDSWISLSHSVKALLCWPITFKSSLVGINPAFHSSFAEGLSFD